MAGNAVKVRAPSGWVDLAYVATGPQGPAGPGVPGGGAAAQFLVKSSGVDYATAWANPAAGGDLRGTYPNPTLKPPLGLGRVIGSEGVASGAMAVGTAYRYEGAAAGTQPLILGPITPPVDCYWPVEAVGLVKSNDAAWNGLNANIRLRDAAATSAKLDADGFGTLTYRCFHYGGLPGDWVSFAIAGQFKLTAGQAYTVDVAMQPTSGGWSYYRGGNQHAWLSSRGVIPR